MASCAYQNYLKNLKDVDRLIKSHKLESGGKAGKKGLGHLTRSGIVMLCAAFEVYIEEIVKETIKLYIERISELKDFPKQIKKRIVFEANQKKDELEVIKLAGDGWKSMILKYVENDINKLNTPKFNVIDMVFNRWIGLNECSTNWSFNRQKLDEFVTIRGEIAHNGAKANYVKISYLVNSRDEITELIQEIDGQICDFITSATCCGQPWRKRY